MFGGSCLHLISGIDAPACSVWPMDKQYKALKESSAWESIISTAGTDLLFPNLERVEGGSVTLLKYNELSMWCRLVTVPTDPFTTFSSPTGPFLFEWVKCQPETPNMAEPYFRS